MEYHEPQNEYYESDSEKEVPDFLADLGSDKFVSPPEINKEEVKTKKQHDKELRAMIMEQERNRKREEREQKARDTQRTKEEKKASKVPKEESDDELFSTNGTAILGKERIILLKKVQQYKSLFPAELKTFKIKKSPTPQELKDALDEMQTLVEVGGMDEFMMSSVLSCMKLVEAGSSNTTYDIRGCADMLKSNKEFNKLARVLFIKYGVFSKIPPEMQMVLLVSTTAYMCNQKNKNKVQLNDYLNTPI